MRRAAPRALVAQNVAREGTAAFRALAARSPRVAALHVRAIDTAPPAHAAVDGGAIPGVYELWDITFREEEGEEAAGGAVAVRAVEAEARA